MCASDLKPKEIDKIRNVKAFRRMSKAALDHAVGFCQKENDWRRGGNSEFISMAN